MEGIKDKEKSQMVAGCAPGEVDMASVQDILPGVIKRMLQATVVSTAIWLCASCASQTPVPAPAAQPPEIKAAAASATTVRTRPEYKCLGNEPFWDVRITGDDIIYTTPENSTSFKLTHFSAEDGVHHYRGESEAGDISIAVKPEACNDTMSDKEYSYSSRVTINGRALRGCAEKLAP